MNVKYNVHGPESSRFDLNKQQGTSMRSIKSHYRTTLNILLLKIKDYSIGIRNLRQRYFTVFINNKDCLRWNSVSPEQNCRVQSVPKIGKSIKVVGVERQKFTVVLSMGPPLKKRER